MNDSKVDPTAETVCILLVKRKGEIWSVAPYPQTNRDRTERLVTWLRNIIPDIEDTRIVEL